MLTIYGPTQYSSMKTCLRYCLKQKPDVISDKREFALDTYTSRPPIPVPISLRSNKYLQIDLGDTLEQRLRQKAVSLCMEIAEERTCNCLSSIHLREGNMQMT